MIPITDSPEVIHDGSPLKRIDMTQMDPESIRVMLEQSRDGFYSNKELAPVREYSTNARDAHIQSGIPTRPIEVTLPTQLEPELRIRDFGKGLTIEALEDIYFRYWKSTKRGTNDQNGCLGIGAKSAFAYSAVYTVITWCNGMKTVATGQKNGFADIIFHQPNTNGEPDGVEIVIPIQQKDISKFIHEALEFFKYWDIRPIFHNIDETALKTAFNIMDNPPFLSGDGWAVRPSGYSQGESKAIMGFVSYDIDWNQVKNSMAPEVVVKVNGIFDFLRENLTSLYFPNGSLSFTPNRESLQYNDATVSVLSQKILDIYDSLLNLISNKISDAPNIWEAKIRYNRIFRKELDSFEKDEVYGGNLNTLERILIDRIQWKGITISNGYFDGLSEWDTEDGLIGARYDNEYTPILTTYVKDKDNTGNIIKVKNRRYAGVNTKIVCSPRSVVIIQDTEKNSMAKGLARWFLQKSGKDISQVYVIDLVNKNVRDAFFKEYNFNTVPVSYVSQNISLIKSYLKTVRAPRGSGSGTGESRPLNCPFVEIKNRRTVNYVTAPAWEHETTNAKNLEDGGIYVVYTKNSFTYNGREISHNGSEYFWQSIYDLALIAGEDIPKVYGIHPKSADSVWFKEAIEDGNWINLSEWVKENSDELPKDIIKKVSAYSNVSKNRIGLVTAALLTPQLVDNNGVAAKYFKEIADFGKYHHTKNIPHYLRIEGFEPEEKDTQIFKKLNGELRNKYPLLFRTALSSEIDNCDENSTYYVLPEEAVKDFSNYINMVDCYA